MVAPHKDVAVWFDDAKVELERHANDLDVLLVDLKSLTWSRGGAPIGRHTACQSDVDCVQPCFGWQYRVEPFEVPDFRCEHGQCGGVDAATMVHATAQLFLERLFDAKLVGKTIVGHYFVSSIFQRVFRWLLFCFFYLSVFIIMVAFCLFNCLLL